MGDNVYWQVAKGDGSHDASAYFLRHDVAAIGPGDWGDFRTNPAVYETNKEWFVRWLATDVLPGHRIVLRSGNRQIIAVGEVCECELQEHEASKVSPAYGYCEAFGDLDGMDWQHFVRVRWQEFPLTLEGDVFGPRPSRLSRFSNTDVQMKVEEILFGAQSRPLKPLPSPLVKLDADQLVDQLFNIGLSHASVNLTHDAIHKIRRIRTWYRQARLWPKEHETVAHMVIPLLIGLGWSEQQLAVEWENIDVAAFGTASDPTALRSRENCKMILEVKRMGDGLMWAKGQARSYRDRLNLHDVRIVVTDGVRYSVFVDSGGDIKPYYINLDIDKLFVESIDGYVAVDALRWMLPFSNPPS